MDNCFICNKSLNKLNTPLRGLSKTKDEKVACTTCHRKVSLKLHITNFNDQVSEKFLIHIKEYKIATENAPKRKWYNRKGLLILLLFVLPPVGIVGVLLRKTNLWKKLVYIPLALFMCLWIFGLLIGLFFPMDYYNNGNRLISEGKFTEAIIEYKKVEPNNENYRESLVKINLANIKIDSIATAKHELIIRNEKDSLNRITEMKVYSEMWADSIVKDWKGSYIKKFKVSKGSDTIYFELSKEASQVNWQNLSGFHKKIYENNYDSLAMLKFENHRSTEIVFTPNPEQQELNEASRLRQQKIYKQFSVWDESHKNLKRLIKNSMNDPKSFEHVETTYTDKGSYLFVYMKFRGTNAFGATVLNTVRAKVDIDGNILSTEQL